MLDSLFFSHCRAIVRRGVGTEWWRSLYIRPQSSGYFDPEAHSKLKKTSGSIRYYDLLCDNCVLYLLCDNCVGIVKTVVSILWCCFSSGVDSLKILVSGFLSKALTITDVANNGTDGQIIPCLFACLDRFQSRYVTKFRKTC